MLIIISNLILTTYRANQAHRICFLLSKARCVQRLIPILKSFFKFDIIISSERSGEVKAVILDMYGVILKQTGDDFIPHVRQTFPELDDEVIYRPWLKADIGEIDSLQIWKEIGFSGDLEKVEKDYLDTIELNDGFIDFIKSAGNHFKTAIISNDSAEWSKYIREKFDINRYFDAISISGDLKIQKPDERIFRLTIEQLGVNAQDCFYIDDREGNLAAAEKLGMKAIMFNSRNSVYSGNTVCNFRELAEKLLI